MLTSLGGCSQLHMAVCPVLLMLLPKCTALKGGLGKVAQLSKHAAWSAVIVSSAVVIAALVYVAAFRYALPLVYPAPPV